MDCVAATWIPTLFNIGSQACYFTNMASLVFPASSSPVLFTATFTVKSYYALPNLCLSIDNAPPSDPNSQATCTAFCSYSFDIENPTDIPPCLAFNSHTVTIIADPLDIGEYHTAVMYISSYYVVDAEGTATLSASALF
jgi:hypothetical protein